MARAFAPVVDVADIVEEARARFLEECDYVLEARRQARFVELFAAHEAIAFLESTWTGAALGS